MLTLYRGLVSHYPPMPEFRAIAGARYGTGQSDDGGRLWDNAAWFDAVYATHYGLHPTPAALIIHPYPLRQAVDDTVDNLTYQGVRLRLRLEAGGYTLTVIEGQGQIVLEPVGRLPRLTVNGSQSVARLAITARAGEVYRIRAVG
jgi:hypothetical protein